MYNKDPMMTSSFVGTHKFLSPEVLTGDTQYRGEPVDVWACGVTLYNMITGKFPFEGKVIDGEDTLPSLYACISNEDFAPAPQIEGDCEKLLRGKSYTCICYIRYVHEGS